MANVTPLRTAAETGLGELFDRLKGSLPGDVAVREQALAGFAERGLPHRRIEEFKYTDLRAVMREAAPPAEKPNPADLALALGDATAFTDVLADRLTIVNGHVADIGEMVAFPAGVEIVRLHDALTSGHSMLAELGRVEIAHPNPIYQLNTAFMADGALIRIAAGTELRQPLHLRFVNHGPAAFSTTTRVLIVVEDGASVTVLESHEGPDGLPYQSNGVVEILTGDRAHVRHVRLNVEGKEAIALSTLTAQVGADATFRSINVVRGAALSRHQVFLSLRGEGTDARVDGAVMLGGRQHADATLVVDHAVPHCTSREMFKSVLDDDAVGVFQGKIIVRPHAQKTDGAMKSDALLVGEGSAMFNKPELEIFADDVVCGHGATCGELNEDLLFYLKSRGLPQAEAESLLLQAFLGEAVEFVEHEGAREALVAIVEGWLAGRRR